MEINSPMTNGIPDNFEILTPEQLKQYRITCGHYLSPTVILRLLEPRAYFAGLIWELEELLKDKQHNLKSGYKYRGNGIYYGKNSNVQAEQMRLSEKEYSEEFELKIIKQLFLEKQQKGNTIVSERQLQVYNTLEPIHSPVFEAQETDTVQTLVNSQQNKQTVHTNTTGGAASCDEVENHVEEQHTLLNCASQNSLECQKEASQQVTQQAGCSDTQNAFTLCCNNIESDIGTEKIVSGFDNRCLEDTQVSRPENEYTDCLSQDTVVKEEHCKLTEQQNFNNNSDKGTLVSWVLSNKDINGSSTSSNNSSNAEVSYLIQEIYQAPVIHLTAQSYSMLEHST